MLRLQRAKTANTRLGISHLSEQKGNVNALLSDFLNMVRPILRRSLLKVYTLHRLAFLLTHHCSCRYLNCSEKSVFYYHYDIFFGKGSNDSHRMKFIMPYDLYFTIQVGTYTVLSTICFHSRWGRNCFIL